MAYFELIIGPMFAGKSTELIRMSKRYNAIGKKCLIINHSLNKRYGSNNITTHDNLELLSNYNVCKLGDIDSVLIEQYDVIIIEELQFYPDAFDNIVNWLNNYNKIIIAAGLDGDCKKQPFGDVLRLIPYTDKVTKLCALCKLCGDGTLAPFTKRIKKANIKIEVGSDDIYEAVCSKHYNL